MTTTNITTLRPTSINTKDCFPVMRSTHKILMESWLKERIQELQTHFDMLGMHQRRFGWDLVLDGKIEELEKFLSYVESLK